MKRETAENATRIALVVMPIALVTLAPGLFDLDTWLGAALGVGLVFASTLAFVWLPDLAGDLASEKPRRGQATDQVIEEPKDPRDQDDRGGRNQGQN